MLAAAVRGRGPLPVLGGGATLLLQAQKVRCRRWDGATGSWERCLFCEEECPGMGRASWGRGAAVGAAARVGSATGPGGGATLLLRLAQAGGRYRSLGAVPMAVGGDPSGEVDSVCGEPALRCCAAGQCRGRRCCGPFCLGVGRVRAFALVRDLLPPARSHPVVLLVPAWLRSHRLWLRVLILFHWP